MALDARTGPSLAFGVTQTSSGLVTEYNEERGPSMFDLGTAMLDPRPYFNYDPGSPVGTRIYGFGAEVAYVDFQPSSASSQAFATSSATQPVAGTAITLLPSSTHGTYTTTIIAPETGKSVSVIAIDSTAQYLAFGTGGTVNLWNPAAGTGRCIAITTSSSGDATFSIAGRDMYGIKMTEKIDITQVTTNSSGLTYTSQKAWKYISSVMAASTITSTGVGIGLTDTYGFPMRVPYAGYNAAAYLMTTSYSSANPIALLSSANTVLALSTGTTPTATTADGRGTYASTTASNGTLRLQMVVVPTPMALAKITASDQSYLFGATPFSSV